MKRTIIASTLFSLFMAHAAVANEQSVSEETAELRKIIKQQQETLKQLERRLDENEQRLEATADAIEVPASQGSGNILGGVTVGGYGELHYNNLTDNDNDTDKKEIDFHRWVLFFGKEFNSTTRFFSEFELEHSLSGEGKDGEVELEQAYIEHDVNDQFSFKAGVFLIPVGLINETHEPPTFHGVERNPVEKNIIPATWWEGGVAGNFEAAPGLSFDAAIHSGLDVSEKGSYKPRDGRQKVSEAAADDLAFTGRVKYTAIPGLELAASAQYQQDITQSDATTDEASATLLTAHAVYQYQNFTLKALYATWDIDGDEAEALGRDEQDGFYIEPSYQFTDEFAVFARYNEWDNNAGNSDDTEISQTTVGISYYLHEDVVFKADYEKQSDAKDIDGFNLGVGYQF